MECDIHINMEDNKFDLDDFDCNFAKEKYTPELEIQVRDDGYVSFIPDPDTESFKLYFNDSLIIFKINSSLYPAYKAV